VNNGTKYKDKLNYSCNTGYDLKGSDSAVCQENATWSVEPPECKIKGETFDHNNKILKS
jgi:hypothetical protein